MINTLLELRLQTVFAVLALSILRAIGFLFGFLLFNWGFGPSVLLRAGIGFALGAPIIVGQFDATVAAVSSQNRLDMFLLFPKELALGYALGLLMSLPFFVLQYAGAITDTYRGESNAGLEAPQDGSIQTTSLLYLVIGFFIFLSDDGLWHAANIFYQSFAIWSLQQPLPQLSADAGFMLLSLLDTVFWFTFLLALPLLLTFFTLDFILAVAAKLARRFRLFDLSFLAKNFVKTLMLPIIAGAIVIYVQSESSLQVEPISILRQFFE